MGTLIGVPRPATGKTKLRNFRIDDAVYDPANRVAAARGESLTDVVERALVAYFRKHRSDDPGPDADLQELRAAARERPRRMLDTDEIAQQRSVGAVKRTARKLMTGKPDSPAARRMRGQDPPA